MSDISIPGVSSKYNTQKLIEDLMKVERIPLERMEERKDRFETQKKTWQEFNRNFSTLRDSAKKLYGHDNPFNERIASSSDQTVLTATASREAVEETRHIRVKQVATADRFLSASVSKDFEVAGGTYTFKVGDDDIDIRFRGGSLKNFAQTITQRSGGLLRSNVVADTPDTQVILIEATKTGSANPLRFGEETLPLAESLGMMKRNLTGTRDIGFGTEKPRNAQGNVEIRSSNMYVGPASSASIPFSPPIKREEGFFIEFEVQVTALPEDSYTPPPPPQGPRTVEGGSVTFKGVTIENDPSQPMRPDWTPPPPPQRVDDDQVLFFTINGAQVPLAPLSEGTHTVRLPLNNFSGDIQNLHINNRNTHREISVSPVRVYNPDQRGDYSPVSPVDRAKDAIVEIDGIEVLRGSNDIDDIIQGVTLHLHEPGNQRIKLDIEPDRELIKEKVIEFVGTYNQLITEINILTARDPGVIDEITYYDTEEREKALEKLGLFQGDTTMMQIKTRLQNIMMNPYQTGLGREFSLLAQAGISTNSTGFGGMDASRLRGYLEMNEQKFDEVLEGKMEALKDMFGLDTDDDLLVDTGVGFSLDQYITPFTQTGGIIASKSSSLDTQIARTDREITTFNEKLERTEQALRRKYGMMEGMLDNLQKSSSALDNLNRSGNDR
ncbi:MAG: flagellar filament capping protein FliD [Spirochaetales bacterium]|nr:flagellar filament capping protein FliD [Spirochaetales bacterium]